MRELKVRDRVYLVLSGVFARVVSINASGSATVRVESITPYDVEIRVLDRGTTWDFA